MFRYASLLSLALASTAFAQYSATYDPHNLPPTSEDGQSGTNQCGEGSDQNSMCQNAYLNSVDDFCLWGPPTPGPDSTIGNTERIEVAWCTRAGYGTRLIPDGTLLGVHFVQTSDYVQVTGVGDLTKINIPAGDEGGELDPHGADGNGNPIGGLVFSNAFGGELKQVHEWTNFVSSTEFCFRACDDNGSQPATYCQHIYDVMGCWWNMPGNYDAGFDRCLADSGEPMGVYGTSTFYQGQPTTPDPHPAPASSSCESVNSISNGQHAARAAIPVADPVITGISTAGTAGVGSVHKARAPAESSSPSRTESSGTTATSAPTGSNGAAPLRSGRMEAVVAGAAVALAAAILA
ncbi:hypothetical protein BD413DRAFT_246324 [Trametes elegans]|nr:hypothetical protein BD413DRAFT_246324 [Trametes elegans]